MQQHLPSILSRFLTTISFWWYRLTTVLSSVWFLLTLEPDKATSFLQSYEAFKYDWADQDEIQKKMGKDCYEKMRQMVIDYYTCCTHLCALGQVEKMYIPPVLDPNKGIIANQDLFEEQMARDLLMNPRSSALEFGCGRGRVSAHMASYTKCRNLVGLQIDPAQLQSARRYATALGLSSSSTSLSMQKNGGNGVLQFRHRDMNDIPHDYPDETFDCIYHVAAFSYCKDLSSMFKDIVRMLKPGG